MTTATLEAPTSTREAELTKIAERFVQTHRRWQNSDREVLTTDYEAAVELLIETATEGDIPNSCRGLVTAVADLGEQWAAFQQYVSQDKPEPRNGFWQAVARVIEQLEGVGEPEYRPLESVATLIAQKVSLTQIAMHIYGTKGPDGKHIGPFMKNGVPQNHLVEKEGREPGSVIPADWVHPEHEARLANEKASAARRLKALAKPKPVPDKGTETIEDLLNQKVHLQQICLIKGCGAQDVMAEAERLGIAVVQAPKAFSPSEVLARKAAEQPVAIPEDDDGDEEPEGDSIDTQIRSAIEAGRSGSQILNTVAGATQYRINKIRAEMKQ